MKDKFIATHAAVSVFKISCAESEKILNQYYNANAFFTQAEDFNSLKTFFIGRTGIGKTAIIKNLNSKIANDPASKNTKCITVSPEDFIFDVAERNELIKELTNQGVNLGLVYKTIWKSVILTEILKSIYGNQKKNWLERLVTTGLSKRAYKFLEENQELDGDKSISERVKGILAKMEHQISLDLMIKDVGVKYAGSIPGEIKDKLNKSLQKFEITELKYFIEKLDTDALKYNKVYIFIDDLDKNWIKSDISKKLIGALFESIIDFVNLEKIKVVISLRSNLFQLIELHQPEKYNQYIESIYWTSEEINNICHRRINTIFQTEFGSSIYKKIFPDKIHTDNNKNFDFDNYLISRTNLRPRDAIHFLSFIFEEIINKNRASQNDIFKAETKYSQDRLHALFAEWRTPYEDIESIVNFFTFTPHKMNKDQLLNIFDQIFDYIDQNKSKTDFKLTWVLNRKYIDIEKMENINLFNLFYKIGLIGTKKTGADKIQYSFQKGNETVNITKTEVAKFYINPCYYRALSTTFHD